MSKITLVNHDSVLDVMRDAFPAAEADNPDPLPRIVLASARRSRAGLQYAMAAASLLTPEEVMAHAACINQVLATFDLFRHGINMLDDVIDGDIHRSRYHMDLPDDCTDAEFIGYAGQLLAQASSAANDLGELASQWSLLSTAFFHHYNQLNGLRENWSWPGADGDALQAYWDEHAGSATGRFYRIPFCLISIFAEDPAASELIARAGYEFGLILHVKNDLHGLRHDILDGDFSWPVLWALREGELDYDQHLVNRESCAAKIDTIMDILTRPGGAVTQFGHAALQRVDHLRHTLSGLAGLGRDVSQMLTVVDHVANAHGILIREWLQTHTQSELA